MSLVISFPEFASETVLANISGGYFIGYTGNSATGSYIYSETFQISNSGANDAQPQIDLIRSLATSISGDLSGVETTIQTITSTLDTRITNLSTLITNALTSNQSLVLALTTDYNTTYSTYTNIPFATVSATVVNNTSITQQLSSQVSSISSDVDSTTLLAAQLSSDADVFLDITEAEPVFVSGTVTLSSYTIGDTLVFVNSGTLLLTPVARNNIQYTVALLTPGIQVSISAVDVNFNYFESSGDTLVTVPDEPLQLFCINYTNWHAFGSLA